MKIDTQPLDGHQVKLSVEIAEGQLNEAQRRAAVKLAKRIKIPGFRPGKAPYPVILRTVGEAAIFEEALELLIDEVYPKVIKEAEIKPYGPGRLDNIPNKEPLVLDFVVPLDAEVELADYKAIRKPYTPEPVTDEAVAEAIETLRERHAIFEPVERKSKKGDVVTIQLGGVVLDDGSDQQILETRSVPIQIQDKAKDENEWPFPGFSKNLLRKSVDDEGDIEHTFPKDYEIDRLKGAPARFHYRVENVKSRRLPELDDNFAATVGEFANLEALRSNVRETLEKQAESNFNETYDAELIDELVEKSEFKYCEQMLDDEIHQVLHELEDRLARQNLDMDIYLKSRKLDEAGLHEEMRPVAEKRLKHGLVLFELGKLEDIQVDRAELEDRAGNTLSYLNSVLPEKDARRLKKQEVRDNVISNVLVDLMSQKAAERLRDYARGSMEQKDTSEEAAEVDEKSVEPALEQAPDGQSETVEP